MSPVAHSIDNYILGKGILKFDRFDADGLPTGLRDVGNCTAFVMVPEEETIEHYSSREGIRTLDKEVASLRRMRGRFTLDEYDKENLRMALFGLADGAWAIRHLTAGDIIGELDFVSMNDVGPKFHVQLWRIKLRPTSEVGFISDDWGTMEFEFTVQSDVANHPTTPYGQSTLMNES